MKSARAAANQDARQRLIRLIHVGKRELGLDDDIYRALLMGSVQKDSTSAMSVPELERVLAHMKKSGFTVRHKSPKDRPRDSAHPPGGLSRNIAQDAQSKKIRALWLSMHEMGAVRDCSEAALGAYVKRITRLDALQWLDGDQASRVIETLKKWQVRVQQATTQQPLAQQIQS